MRYCVYIIRSSIDKSYYRGFSENPLLRLQQHNNGESKYTSGKMPWQLVFIQSFNVKSDALKREQALKKYDLSRLERLIASPLNELSDYMPDVD